MNVTVLAKGSALEGRAQAFSPWGIHRLSTPAAQCQGPLPLSTSESGSPGLSLDPSTDVNSPESAERRRSVCHNQSTLNFRK